MFFIYFYLEANLLIEGVVHICDVSVSYAHAPTSSGHAALSCSPHLCLLAVEKTLAWSGHPDGLLRLFDVSTLHCDVR